MHGSSGARVWRAPRRPQPDHFSRGHGDDSGAVSLEYAMLIAFIVIAIAAALLSFTTDVGSVIAAVGTHIASWSGGLS